MKRAKYQKVVGLVAYWNMRLASFTAQNMSISEIWKDKTVGNLNEISYL